MKAMVMAAGLGLRMRPLTETVPKPLIPLAGVPLIDYSLNCLMQSGVEEAVVNSHYLAPLLEAHLSKRSEPHIHISYEKTLLDTGGALKKALAILGTAPFFSLNSDAFCLDGKTPCLTHLRSHWNDSLDALLLLQPIEKTIGYEGQGDFFLQSNGSVKRRGAHISAPFVFTGIQLLHPRLFADTPAGAFSLNLLYDRLLAAGSSRLKAIIHQGDWLHVGDTKGLRAAEMFLAQRS